MADETDCDGWRSSDSDIRRVDAHANRHSPRTRIGQIQSSLAALHLAPVRHDHPTHTVIEARMTRGPSRPAWSQMRRALEGADWFGLSDAHGPDDRTALWAAVRTAPPGGGG
jgi:hypothetical protein